ncbi:MAG: hypothetical protein KDK36_08830, partial [Leptospiraceae bacterium]|nr:hypothetical protein [Leptospiraceae bacterium]
DGNGTNASFLSPSGVVQTKDGNYFVLDANNKLRKIDSNANVTTINNAFDYPCQSCGTFNSPSGIAVDSQGNIFIADTNNHKIRKISTLREVSTFAGDGTAGTINATGTSARFYYPQKIVADSSNNLFVLQGSSSNCYIRKITPAGVVSTFVGNGTCSQVEGTGTGSSILANENSGMTIDNSNNIYISNSSNFTMQKITPLGVVTKSPSNSNAQGNSLTIDNSGNIFIGRLGYINKTDLNFNFSSVFNIRNTSCGVDSNVVNVNNGCFISGVYSIEYNNIDGKIWFVDASRLGWIDVNNSIMQVGSGGIDLNDGELLSVSNRPGFNSSKGLKFYKSDLFIADTGNHAIRRKRGNIVTTIAGSGSSGSLDGGQNLSEFYTGFKGLAKNQLGDLIILTTNYTGVIFNPIEQKFYNSEITSSSFDSKGNFYFINGHQIWKRDTLGNESLFAGSTIGTNDGTLLQAKFFNPNEIAVNSNDDIIIVEASRSYLRKISLFNGIVSSKSISGFTITTGYKLLKDSKGNIYRIIESSVSGTNQITKVSSDLNMSFININGLTTPNNIKAIDSNNSLLILQDNIFYKADLP